VERADPAEPARLEVVRPQEVGRAALRHEDRSPVADPPASRCAPSGHPMVARPDSDAVAAGRRRARVRRVAANRADQRRSRASRASHPAAFAAEPPWCNPPCPDVGAAPERRAAPGSRRARGRPAPPRGHAPAFRRRRPSGGAGFRRAPVRRRAPALRRAPSLRRRARAGRRAARDGMAGGRALTHAAEDTPRPIPGPAPTIGPSIRARPPPRSTLA